MVKRFSSSNFLVLGHLHPKKVPQGTAYHPISLPLLMFYTDLCGRTLAQITACFLPVMMLDKWLLDRGRGGVEQ